MEFLTNLNGLLGSSQAKPKVQNERTECVTKEDVPVGQNEAACKELSASEIFGFYKTTSDFNKANIAAAKAPERTEYVTREDILACLGPDVDKNKVVAGFDQFSEKPFGEKKDFIASIRKDEVGLKETFTESNTFFALQAFENLV